MLYKINELQLVPASETLMDSVEEESMLLKYYSPQKRTVHFDEEFKPLQLPFPYLSFIRTEKRTSIGVFSSLRIVMTLESPTLDSKIYVPPLGNISLYSYSYSFIGSLPDSVVCTSHMHEQRTFNNMIEYFWSSAFSCDGWYSQYLPYPKWQDIEMNDVLNPEHWIQYCDYPSRLKGNLLSWITFPDNYVNSNITSLAEIKTLRDFLELWE